MESFAKRMSENGRLGGCEGHKEISKSGRYETIKSVSFNFIMASLEYSIQTNLIMEALKLQDNQSTLEKKKYETNWYNNYGIENPQGEKFEIYESWV